MFPDPYSPKVVGALELAAPSWTEVFHKGVDSSHDTAYQVGIK